MMIRNLKESDYDYVIERLNDWWGGRQMTEMLPRLFFKHFNESCFVYIKDKNIIGFVVGFISSTNPSEAYIHFVGVDPECRELGVASELYESFFEYCKNKRIAKVSCVTSPVNKTSINFHHSKGFEASEYDEQHKPIAIKSYDGPNEDRVLFSKMLIT